MNNINFILSLLFVGIAFANANSVQISTFNRYKTLIANYLKDCKINTFDTCIIDGIERIRPQLQEPLNVGTLHFSIPNKKIKKITLDNVVVRGSSNFKIENMDMRIYEHIINFEVKFPQIDLTADYDMQGSLYGLVGIKTFGNLHGFYTNVKTVVNSIVSYTRKDGELSLQIDDIRIRFSVGHAYMKLMQADDSYLGYKIAQEASSKPTSTLAKVLPILEKEVTRFIKQHIRNQ